jgi:hypothetical protein
MTTEEKMKSNKKTARIVGAFFLIAMVASLLGLGLLEPILDAPDFLTNVHLNRTQVVIAVLLDVVTATAVVGIAVFMFPILRRFNEALALGYVILRAVEAVVLVVAVIGPLSLIALSQEYVNAGAPDASYFQTLGTSFIEVRAQLAGLMLGIFFSLAALVFYYLLYQSKLVPRFISVWGLIAVAGVLAVNLLEIFGISFGAAIILALPIILNEIFLAIWLIVKGFNSSAIVSESAKTNINENVLS